MIYRKCKVAVIKLHLINTDGTYCDDNSQPCYLDVTIDVIIECMMIIGTFSMTLYCMYIMQISLYHKHMYILNTVYNLLFSSCYLLQTGHYLFKISFWNVPIAVVTPQGKVLKLQTPIFIAGKVSSTQYSITALAMNISRPYIILHEGLQAPHNAAEKCIQSTWHLMI